MLSLFTFQGAILFSQVPWLQLATLNQGPTTTTTTTTTTIFCVVILLLILRSLRGLISFLSFFWTAM